MAFPQSPIAILAGLLQNAPTLKGYAGTGGASRKLIFVGKSYLASSDAPPRIVMFPVEGGYQVPHDTVDSMVDVDLKLMARLWGADIDGTWDLRQRFWQAMNYQAHPENIDPVIPGYYFQYLSEEWDVNTDTAEQGQALTVLFVVRMSAAEVPTLTRGEVDDLSLTRGT